jgi:UDP-N-acetylmuramoyl-L-alanyl-D-glutamate--2,6-diaminopimelate ligase
VQYTWPSIAAITNLTPESLEYHGTIQQYQIDKGKLFYMLKGRGTKILNGSDESSDEYQNISSAETIIYNKQGSDLWVEGIEEQAQKVTGMLHTDLGGSVPLVLNIPGAYNLENAQCAISVCTTLGVPLDRCIRALETFSSVPGRLEKVDEGQDFLTFVDFAMTENGYRQVLGALRSMVGSNQKVIVLFGCIGNRMKEKRQTIAQVVSDLADIAIVTSDETYGEDPHAVHEEVWASIDQSMIEAEKVFDRREAIECALRKAQSGDVVICCGMGPFSTFNTPEGPIPWSEKEIIREALRAL